MAQSTADRVKELRKTLGLTQQALGALAGVSKQAVSQWERDLTEPQWEALHALRASQGVNPRWLLHGEAPMLFEAEPSPQVSARSLQLHPILLWDDPAELPEGQYVLIPRRRVAFSAGNGTLMFEEEEAPPLAFTSDWARQTGIRPGNAVVVYAKGDSMEPGIREGDVLLIDTGVACEEIRDGQVYAIRYGQELRVKRLFRRYDDALILRSDNSARYPDEIVPPEHLNGLVHVIGRVVWRAGEV
ncbi:XRE family transcriptional regulator [Marichromatium bheemlicum]|uniref:Helix-turn-helix transcriptional regulator n=1 Tax=Marichromatium bheemlicum TaxID=365339 RepID=A0ABX1I8T2_9GAMM|nr:helix-turn-helix transcriptional regulator [Marichromatium bheemlicum]NKN33965.1 helix-turn-helix transcriptional regulator [Marichromatium bheemlicum]